MTSPARIVAAAVACCFIAGGAWSQGVTPRTIVLGQSAPLSGALQSLGEEIRNGALANAQRLVEELRVFALFGYPAANVSRELLAVPRSRQSEQVDQVGLCVIDGPLASIRH